MQSSGPRPPRSCKNRAQSTSSQQVSSQETSSSTQGRHKLTQTRARELFGGIIGRVFRDPGSSELNFSDQGLFECTDIGVYQGKPVVYRTPTGDSSRSFEETSPVDLRDVLEQLAPGLNESFEQLERFSLTQVIKKYELAIVMLNDSQTLHSQRENEEVSRRQRLNGHFPLEEDDNDEEEEEPRAQRPENSNEDDHENATQDPDPQPNPEDGPFLQERTIQPTEYHDKTCILDIHLDHLGLLTQLFPSGKHLNGQVRSRFKQLMTRAVQNLLDEPNNERAIKEYVLLPIAILSKKETRLFTVSKALQHLEEGDWSPFTLDSFARRTAPAIDEETHKKIKTKIAGEYIRMGGISKAYATSIRAPPSNRFAPGEILNFFITIHPRRHYQIEPMSEQTKNGATQVTHCHVLAGIRRAKPLKAPGIGSLRFDHLKYMTAGEEFDAPSPFLIAFAQLINLIACARIPPLFAAFLFQTKGLGIPKAPTGVRPIGMRDVHVNLTINILMKENGADIVEIFKDCNFALNGPKGIDKAIIHCNLWREIYPEHDSVYVDGTAAYQRVRRDVSLRSSKEHLPGMAPLLHALHENPSRIWIQDGQQVPIGVSTEEGTTQGCGGGTIQYAFGAKEVYDKLQETAGMDIERPAYFNAYSDDGNIGADTNKACELVQQYQTDGLACGVLPNLAKTFVLLGRKDNVEEVERAIVQYQLLGVSADKIRIHPANGGKEEDYGVKYLGVPIGSDKFIIEWMKAKKRTYKAEIKALLEVVNPQHKWIFLYYCFARKPSYVLRHILPSLAEDFSVDFDAMLRMALESVINCKVSDLQWVQVTVPIKHGGCGLPATKDVANAAFTANAIESREYVLRRLPDHAKELIDPQPEDGDPESRFTQQFMACFEQCKNIFISQVEENDKETPEEQWKQEITKHLEQRTLQYFFTNIMTKQGKRHIKEQLNQDNTRTEHAVFLSVAKQHTGDFLLACPKTAATTFLPHEFIMALRIRLGCDLPNIPTRCTCRKQPYLDKKGIHLLLCKKGGAPIHRHDGIQNVIKALATSAGVQASSCCKDVVVMNEAGGDNRRGDLMLPQCGDNGKNLLLDFTIRNPASASLLDATRGNPNTAIKRAEKEKNDKYKERAAANDIEFMPMALECYGALSKNFVKVLNMLCEKKAQMNKGNKSAIMNYWYKRISCTLHKGNSSAIARRMMDITKEVASCRDECFDVMVVQEYGNNDTACHIIN